MRSNDKDAIIEKQNNELTVLRNENAVLKDTLSELQQQLNWMKKQIFGSKSEKTYVLMDGCMQLSMFSDADSENMIASDKEETITVPTHKRKKKRTHDDWMSSLEIKEEIHHLESDALICDKCGAEMKVIGTEKAWDELVYVPEKYFIRRHMTETAKCIKCGSDESLDLMHDDIDKCSFRKSKAPSPLIPHSFCSRELIANIIYDKYNNAMPLYRIEKSLANKKIYLSRETMANWVIHMAENWGAPIILAMKAELLKSNVIHADETPFRVLHEEGRKATTDSKMWVYCNGKLSDKSIVIFDYKPTRKSEHPVEFLKGFSGYLVCDGYQGYNAVQGVTRCACLAHIRRKFLKSLPSDKKQHQTSASAKVIGYITQIYSIEERLRDVSPETRYEQRLAETKPLLDALYSYLETVPTLKGSFSDAVRYALNEKKYIYSFLESPDVPVDNNRCENSIRPFTVGRKNWLHANTPSGAKANAIWYSIISTAYANGLNVEQYLIKLFSNPAGNIVLPWD
jgi:transposase